MATYLQLNDAVGASTLDPLRKQILVAVMIKANTIAKLATPTAAQKAFAVAALADPTAYLATLLNYILAEYNMQTIATIQAATDTQVQTAVNAAVDTLLG